MQTAPALEREIEVIFCQVFSFFAIVVLGKMPECLVIELMNFMSKKEHALWQIDNFPLLAQGSRVYLKKW